MKTSGVGGRPFSKAAGHDVSTVAQQQLTSSLDDFLIEQCRNGGRGLVSLDLDFSNPLRFLPSRYPGIAVLRLPAMPTVGDLLNCLHTLAEALRHDTLEGKLWIVELGRVRVYQESDH